MARQNSTQIAARARSLIAVRQIKQTTIAERMSLSPMALSRRLRGDVSFTAEELSALADVLEVPVADLYTEAA